MTDAQQLVQQARRAIQTGDNEKGQRLLAQVLQANPQDETAWLWMAVAIESPQKRRECLQRVLSINPDHALARQALASTDARETVKREAPPSPASAPTDGVLRCEVCDRPLGPQLSHHVFRLYHTTLSSGRNLSSSEHLFVLKSNPDHSPDSVSGDLEERILQATAEWDSRVTLHIQMSNDNENYVRKLRHALTVHDLVILILEGNWSNPAEHLISEIVGVDASRRGVGQSKGRLIKRFQISATDRQMLRASYEVVRDARRRFETSQPEIHQAIKKAFEARVDTG